MAVVEPKRNHGYQRPGRRLGSAASHPNLGFRIGPKAEKCEKGVALTVVAQDDVGASSDEPLTFPGIGAVAFDFVAGDANR